MTTIAHVGAFSISNYGDQVYPQIFEALFRHCGVAVELQHFGLEPGALPDGRAVGPLSSLPADEFDAVVVGGGDLIRVDKRTVAFDHLRVETNERHRRLQKFRAAVYAKTRLRGGEGPWLPSSGWGAPTALASVGVHTLPDVPAIRMALSHISGAWARTSRGVEILRARGMAEESVFLGPDAVFALPLASDRNALVERGGQVLRSACGERDGVAVFQAARFAGWDPERLAAVMRASAPVPVVVLPLGAYNREDLMLRKAADLAGVPFLGLLDADDITAVLAAAGCVVTTSMHAAIVAASLGRPAVTPGVAKTAGAFEACPEPPRLLQVQPTEISTTVRNVHGSATFEPSPANVDAVVEATGRIAKSLGMM